MRGHLYGQAPPRMVTSQPAFAQSNAHAGQTEPRHRHAVMELCTLRGVDSSASGSGNLGDLWNGRSQPLCPRRQLSLPNVLFKRTWTRWPKIGPAASFLLFPIALIPSFRQTERCGIPQTFRLEPCLHEASTPSIGLFSPPCAQPMAQTRFPVFRTQ